MFATKRGDKKGTPPAKPTQTPAHDDKKTTHPTPPTPHSPTPDERKLLSQSVQAPAPAKPNDVRLNVSGGADPSRPMGQVQGGPPPQYQPMGYPGQQGVPHYTGPYSYPPQGPYPYPQPQYSGYGAPSPYPMGMPYPGQPGPFPPPQYHTPPGYPAQQSGPDAARAGPGPKISDQLQNLSLQRDQMYALHSSGSHGGLSPGGATSPPPMGSPHQSHQLPPQGLPMGIPPQAVSAPAIMSGGTVTASDDDWEIDPNELVISKEIARGSFGVVYKASFRGSEVAVKKLIMQKLTDEQMKDFVAEVNMMKKLHHPNVMMLVGVCSRPPNMLMVSEFLEGSLWNLLHEPTFRLDFKMQLRMITDTARGMNYLHLFKPPIVHRDLKSPNLLYDHNYNVKICDFGLARVKASMMTSNLGTCQYMAPEVIQSQSYTEKADVYSFAIVMWEILSRQAPYLGLQPMQIAYGVIHQKTRPPIGPQMPKPLVEIMQAAWHPDPNLRPSFQVILDRLKSIPSQ